MKTEERVMLDTNLPQVLALSIATQREADQVVRHVTNLKHVNTLKQNNKLTAIGKLKANRDLKPRPKIVPPPGEHNTTNSM